MRQYYLYYKSTFNTVWKYIIILRHSWSLWDTLRHSGCSEKLRVSQSALEPKCFFLMTVVFDPEIGNKSCQSVEFTRVLHVPQLGNNLLAVLFLTRQRWFHVHIDENCINFHKDKKKLFIAPINDNNTAFLSGSTQSVLVSSTFDSANFPLPFHLITPSGITAFLIKTWLMLNSL